MFFQEDMMRDTTDVVARVLSWLHLPPLPSAALHDLVKSKGGLAIAPGRQASRALADEVETSYPALYKALQRLYSHHNARLAALLDEKFGTREKALPPEWVS